jgi:uncharacterized protein (DUF433 family)
MDTLESTQIVPLSMRPDGTIHVTGSRVTLDTIVASYKAGESAEAIHEGFPTLPLAQIYGILQYFHEHRHDVEAYLRRREEQAREMQQQHSAESAHAGLRGELLARRAHAKLRSSG